MPKYGDYPEFNGARCDIKNLAVGDTFRIYDVESRWFTTGIIKVFSYKIWKRFPRPFFQVYRTGKYTDWTITAKGKSKDEPQ